MSDSKAYNKEYGDFVASQRGYCGFRNRMRIGTFTRAINPQESDRILEIGCNRGLLLQELAKHAGEAIGVDVNVESEDGPIRRMSATDLKFEDGRFDKVCALHVIEHVDDLPKAFQEAHRVLKDQGRFIICFPFEPIRGSAAVIDAVNVHRSLFYARKLHVHKLFPRSIKRLITKAGLGFSVVLSKTVFVPAPCFLMVLRKGAARA